MKWGRNLVVLALITVILLGVQMLKQTRSGQDAYSLSASQLQETTTVTIGEKTFIAEVAATADQQMLGLSKRNSLASGHGMLFPFSPPDQPAFWMKDMRFSIDLLWISNNKIIGIERALAVPEPGAATSELPQVWPPAPVDYVLEMNAGEADSLTTGDSVSIKAVQGV